MVNTDYALKVNNELKFSQKFSDIKFNIPENMQPYSDKLNLRHDEIYDSGDLINPLRKQLENGDIFLIGECKYILVAQACDMMVRGKGKKQGLRNAQIATLLKITTQTIKEHSKKKKDNDHYLRDKHPLIYFNKGKDELGVVDFTDSLIININYLDICVFNSNGECKINIINSDVDRRYLSKTWEMRYDIIFNELGGIQNKLSEIRKYLKPNNYYLFRKKIGNTLFRFLQKKGGLVTKNTYNADLIEKEFYPKLILASTQPFKDNVIVHSDGTFDFSIKRIAKYKDYGATYLLERYTRHLSRIAEPHDFAG